MRTLLSLNALEIHIYSKYFEYGTRTGIKGGLFPGVPEYLTIQYFVPARYGTYVGFSCGTYIVFISKSQLFLDTRVSICAVPVPAREQRRRRLYPNVYSTLARDAYLNSTRGARLTVANWSRRCC